MAFGAILTLQNTLSQIPESYSLIAILEHKSCNFPKKTQTLKKLQWVRPKNKVKKLYEEQVLKKTPKTRKQKPPTLPQLTIVSEMNRPGLTKG